MLSEFIILCIALGTTALSHWRTRCNLRETELRLLTTISSQGSSHAESITQVLTGARSDDSQLSAALNQQIEAMKSEILNNLNNLDKQHSADFSELQSTVCALGHSITDLSLETVANTNAFLRSELLVGEIARRVTLGGEPFYREQVKQWLDAKISEAKSKGIL